MVKPIAWTFDAVDSGGNPQRLAFEGDGQLLLGRKADAQFVDARFQVHQGWGF